MISIIKILSKIVEIISYFEGYKTKQEKAEADAN